MTSAILSLLLIGTSSYILFENIKKDNDVCYLNEDNYQNYLVITPIYRSTNENDKLYIYGKIELLNKECFNGEISVNFTSFVEYYYINTNNQNALISYMNLKNEVIIDSSNETYYSLKIEPIKEITEIAHAHGALMHTDAVQAAGNIPVDVKDLGVDLMSMSGHKIYGPKGIGSLYIRKGVRIHNLIHGGAQERKKRAGTENIPAIVGYGKAAEMAKENMEHHIAELTRLREKLIAGVMERIPHTRLNGHRTDRLPGNTNFSFEFIEGEGILLLLDQVGIAGSSGSACTSGSLDPSHVLMAIGLTHEWAHGSLRLTVGDFTTDEDIDYILEKLPPVIERLRMLSPLYNTYLKEQKEKQAVK